MSRLSGAYFDWQPIGQHLAGCRRPAWDVQALRRDDRLDGGYEAGMRVVCWSCGTVRELTARIGPEQHTDTGEALSSAAERLTAAWVTGYGQPAVKAAGLWLHPGPAMLARPGAEPCGYLVTATSTTPRTPADVLGAIAQGRGRRGGLMWTASVGYDPATATATGLPSRTAATRWITARIERKAS
ncbi:hypothetical protein AB0395_29755 [Streptosporangium sp. NPDC051023]|uniref:hypothetical protein n=1 Tax=Streptosporangium sp. NPDC051023 TaxID=3155410 RepID=UPI00344E113D